MASDVLNADELLEDVPLGRNRFLKVLGGALFGFTTGLILRDQDAQANHNGPAPPCFGYRRCHNCNGYGCNAYCSWPHSSGNGHCPYGYNQCWQSCYQGTYYRCCDWHEKLPGMSTYRHCVCRGYAIGPCPS